jgi:hypothetical protein
VRHWFPHRLFFRGEVEHLFLTHGLRFANFLIFVFLLDSLETLRSVGVLNPLGCTCFSKAKIVVITFNPDSCVRAAGESSFQFSTLKFTRLRAAASQHFRSDYCGGHACHDRAP